MKANSAVGIYGTIDYDSGRTHRSGGIVTSGQIVRSTDGLGHHLDKARLATSNSSEKSLILDISGIVNLPDLIAGLVLVPSEGDESKDELCARLELRDEIAKAFEEAASRLRRAPRQ